MCVELVKIDPICECDAFYKAESFVCLVGKNFEYTYNLILNSSFKWSAPETQGAGLSH